MGRGVSRWRPVRPRADPRRRTRALVHLGTSTAVGAIAGDLLGDPDRLGLDAAFPAIFLAILVGQIDGPRGGQAAILGAAITLCLVPLAPIGLPIVAAAAACLLGLRK